MGCLCFWLFLWVICFFLDFSGFSGSGRPPPSMLPKRSQIHRDLYIIEKAPILKASQNPRKPKNIKPSGCPGESSKFANSDFTPPSVGQGSVGQGSVVQGSQRSAVAQNEAGGGLGGTSPPGVARSLGF